MKQYLDIKNGTIQIEDSANCLISGVVGKTTNVNGAIIVECHFVELILLQLRFFTILFLLHSFSLAN